LQHVACAQVGSEVLGDDLSILTAGLYSNVLVRRVHSRK
jgi:hypothetical protein